MFINCRENFDIDSSQMESLWEDDFELPEPAEDELPVIERAKLIGIRCAAHTVQLSVHDVLKKESLSKFLKKTRQLVKTLRAQPYVNSFQFDKRKKLPFLDGETRWGSSYLMVECLYQQQGCINDLLAQDLQKLYNANYWKRVEQFVTAAKPLFILTKRIQEEALTCGTFFLYWKECCLELEDANDMLARQLLEALLKRQPMWFDNPAFHAALYMDPRLNEFDPPVLTQDQKEKAIVSNFEIKKVI